MLRNKFRYILVVSILFSRFSWSVDNDIGSSSPNMIVQVCDQMKEKTVILEDETVSFCGTNLRRLHRIDYIWTEIKTGGKCIPLLVEKELKIHKPLIFNSNACSGSGYSSKQTCRAAQSTYESSSKRRVDTVGSVLSFSSETNSSCDSNSLSDKVPLRRVKRTKVVKDASCDSDWKLETDLSEYGGFEYDVTCVYNVETDEVYENKCSKVSANFVSRAFIPSAFNDGSPLGEPVTDSDGVTRNYFPEPPHGSETGTYASGDNRRAHQAGTFRLAVEASFAENICTQVNSKPSTSHRRQVVVPGAGALGLSLGQRSVEAGSKSAKITDVVKVCGVGEASLFSKSAYPFLPSPNIDTGINVYVRGYTPCEKITYQVISHRDNFPGYESEGTITITEKVGAIPKVTKLNLGSHTPAPGDSPLQLVGNPTIIFNNAWIEVDLKSGKIKVSY